MLGVQDAHAQIGDQPNRLIHHAALQALLIWRQKIDWHRSTYSPALAYRRATFQAPFFGF